VLSAERADALAVTAMARVESFASAGVDPRRMGIGVVPAVRELLRRTGRELSDFELVEINEAFAAQVLACLKAMASESFCREHLGRDEAIGELELDRLNVNGGGIALGHPVGATGARLVLTLLHEMKRRNVDRAIAAVCVGGGQGAAMLLERE